MKKSVIRRSFTNRNLISTQLYLKDISKYKLIKPDEEVRLILLTRKGDEEARNQLISSNLRFVVSIAKLYMHNGLILQDLVSDGNIGLIEAAHRYDETRGFRFITYAVWWIRRYITRGIHEQSKIIKMPKDKLSLINKINHSKDEFEQQNLRLPTIDETAEMVNIDKHELTQIMLSSSNCLYLENAELGVSEINLYDILIDRTYPLPDGQLIQESIAYEINQSLKRLNRLESVVIKMFYGIGGYNEHSVFGISRKLNISEDRVRLLKQLGLKKLRTNPANKRLRMYLDTN